MSILIIVLAAWTLFLLLFVIARDLLTRNVETPTPKGPSNVDRNPRPCEPWRTGSTDNPN